MNKEFIPYEQALELKELGFDEECFGWYSKDGKFYEQDDKFENGIIKEIPENYSGCVRVVFHCAGEWENYMNYTSQLTPLKNLRLGWK